MLMGKLSDSWMSINQQQRHKGMKLTAMYMILLLLSVNASAAQNRGLSHQIDNRNSEIDPFWYVDRGVRPIGRFGKRQMKSNRSPRPAVNNLEWILSALREEDAFNSDQPQGREDTY